MPHDLGLHCLSSTYHKKDARLAWVKTRVLASSENHGKLE